MPEEEGTGRPRKSLKSKSEGKRKQGFCSGGGRRSNKEMLDKEEAGMPGKGRK